MARPRIDFCEQSNRKTREAQTFKDPKRIQRSFLAAAEKRALVWLAERTPGWVNPDYLTLLGFGAQVMAGISYALARENRLWLAAVIGFLGLNWLGDSLDGTLARVRHRQRPRYGFYVDHMIDSIGGLCLMSGLAFSGYMHPYFAIGLLVAYLLLSIQSYLATYTMGEFQLSFWSFGPTELRILLSIGNIALFYRPMIFGGRFRLFDVGGLVGLAGMTVILLFFTARNTRRLYAEERLS